MAKTRIQVSIHPDLVAAAERMMKPRSFDSFSEYLETLIREEQERRVVVAAASLADAPAVGGVPDARQTGAAAYALPGGANFWHEILPDKTFPEADVFLNQTNSSQ